MIDIATKQLFLQNIGSPKKSPSTVLSPLKRAASIRSDKETNVLRIKQKPFKIYNLNKTTSVNFLF